uniref:Uncharacterized protein n=1 Tax=Magallana gigas TaxID=29159 RepID=K1QPV6_MAGGI
MVSTHNHVFVKAAFKPDTKQYTLCGEPVHKCWCSKERNRKSIYEDAINEETEQDYDVLKL